MKISGLIILKLEKYEKYAYFMGMIVQNYGKAFKIQPDNEELFDKLDRAYQGIYKKLPAFSGSLKRQKRFSSRPKKFIRESLKKNLGTA